MRLKELLSQSIRRPFFVYLQVNNRNLLCTVTDANKIYDIGVRLDDLIVLPVPRIREVVEASIVQTLPELDDALVLAPSQGQEVWAAGVTYKRSKVAREEESRTPDVYDLVYNAYRPELFFKARPGGIVGPDSYVGIRSDSSWDVPEPELAVLFNSQGQVVGYSCGNDMSSRSIEAENPLYLPQAKIYDKSCAIGPALIPAWSIGDIKKCSIRMVILRNGDTVFDGNANLSEMKRSIDELAEFMFRHYEFPKGVWLLTGTGIVPENEFTLRQDDEIIIEISGLGVLKNKVQKLIPNR